MKRRASTLVTALIVLALLALVALTIASSLMSHYNLSARYRDTAQADGLAQGAVEEFILRCREIQAAADVTALPPELLPPFRGHQVLLPNSGHLQGEVTLLLDPPYNSRDNSLSPLPARGCFDGPSQTSIPPFSLDLILQVDTGGRRFLYQALLQQRWPYAVAAAGPIRILGGWPESPPARVQGAILATESPLSQQGSSEGVEMSGTLFGLLLPFSSIQNSPPGQNLVQIGGRLDLVKLTTTRDNEGVASLATLVEPVETSGARVEGPIHLYRNEPRPPSLVPGTVVVHSGSVHQGEVREDYRLDGRDPRDPRTAASLERILAMPDISHWLPIDAQLEPYLYMESITQDVILTSHRERQGQPNTLYVAGGRALCRKSLEFQTRARLVLDDCSLGCEGNLSIASAPDSPNVEVLKGANATLLVQGTLRVDGGRLDAGGNGMVIMARQFFLRANGQYNGLLVAQEGGAFFGQQGGSQPGLTIHGGVLIGSNHARLRFPHQVRDPEGSLVEIPAPPDLLLREFSVAGTTIEYSPRYLRGLNQFGGLHLQALIRRP